MIRVYDVFVVRALGDSLASSGGAGVQLARQPPRGGTRWVLAFSIFCRLKISDFDFFFLFLGLALHVTFHLFVVCFPRCVASPWLDALVTRP